MDFLSETKADVYSFQETKAAASQVDDLLWPSGYRRIWNSAEKAGYAGTAIFTRHEPKQVTMGIGAPKHDAEGRVINAEFETFFLVNVYTPNSQRGLTRLAYRIKEWEPAFQAHLGRLAKAKPVVVCGDFNVAHRPIDLANPKPNERNAGFTAEERACMDRLLASGFIDSFREFHPEPGKYTWWSYMNHARSRNIGWRIDYFCLSASLRPRLTEAFILDRVQGSDHCPVGICLDAG